MQTLVAVGARLLFLDVFWREIQKWRLLSGDKNWATQFVILAKFASCKQDR